MLSVKEVLSSSWTNFSDKNDAADNDWDQVDVEYSLQVVQSKLSQLFIFILSDILNLNFS